MTVTLTDRQEQIAALIAEGMPRKAIGDRLGLSVNTVAAYIENIARRIPGEGTPMRRIMLYWIERKRRETVLHVK